MEKNRNLDVFTKIYKPYKITKINSVYVFNTTSGDYVVKLNPKIDYRKLYSYLNSRSFDYVPELSVDSRDDMVVLEYQEDITLDNEQKALDLINLVSLLHNKTSYYKDVTNDKYKEIYDNVKNNILYVMNIYEECFDRFLEEEFTLPSHYLFLRNYTLIYNAIRYSLNKLDSWYSNIVDKSKQRVVLVHNNLKLEHFIKNTSDYLVSWDKYSFDTPVLDLYNFYLNEWENVSFDLLIDEYDKSFSLLDEEKDLFCILIGIPFLVDFNETEYENCREVRKLINYLDKSSRIVLKWPEKFE